MGRPVSELYDSCLGSKWKTLDNVCRHENIDDSPQPCFEPRGSLISPYQRLEALTGP